MSNAIQSEERGINSTWNSKKGLITVNPGAISILLGGNSKDRGTLGRLPIGPLERQLEEWMWSMYVA